MNAYIKSCELRLVNKDLHINFNPKFNFIVSNYPYNVLINNLAGFFSHLDSLFTHRYKFNVMYRYKEEDYLIKNGFNKNIIFPLFIGAHRKTSTVPSVSYLREIETLDHLKISKKRKIARLRSMENLHMISLPNVYKWISLREKSPTRYIQYRNWESVKHSLLDQMRDDYHRFNPDFIMMYSPLFSIIFFIINWIEELNKKDYEKDITQASGTVIIDEVDVHMHPNTHYLIRNILERTFPNIQFIISTYSPHIIATAKKNEVLILNSNTLESNQIDPVYKSFSGWNTEQIFEDIIGVNLENKRYNHLLQDAFIAFDKKDRKKLIEIIKILEEITHPSDTIVAQLKIKLASMIVGDFNDLY